MKDDQAGTRSTGRRNVLIASGMTAASFGIAVASGAPAAWAMPIMKKAVGVPAAAASPVVPSATLEWSPPLVKGERPSSTLILTLARDISIVNTTYAQLFIDGLANGTSWLISNQTPPPGWTTLQYPDQPTDPWFDPNRGWFLYVSATIPAGTYEFEIQFDPDDSDSDYSTQGAATANFTIRDFHVSPTATLSINGGTPT